MFHKAFFLELAEERVDQTGAYTFAYPSSELADYAVAVLFSFVEDGQDVEAREVGDQFVYFLCRHVFTGFIIQKYIFRRYI